MNYTIMADQIRGWHINKNGKKCDQHRKRKPGMSRINNYRKLLKSAGIKFDEVFIPANTEHYPEALKELHQKFTEYSVDQNLYVFIMRNK